MQKNPGAGGIWTTSRWGKNFRRARSTIWASRLMKASINPRERGLLWLDLSLTWKVGLEEYPKTVAVSFSFWIFLAITHKTSILTLVAKLHCWIFPFSQNPSPLFVLSKHFSDLNGGIPVANLTLQRGMALSLLPPSRSLTLSLLPPSRLPALSLFPASVDEQPLFWTLAPDTKIWTFQL